MPISTLKTDYFPSGLFEDRHMSPVEAGLLPDRHAPGLSLSHTSTQSEKLPPPKVGTFRLVTAIGGTCCRITETAYPKPCRTLPVDGSPGRKIRGFSGTSRRRMQEVLNSIDQTKIRSTHFASLSCRRDSMDWKAIERARRAWVERFRRKWGDDNATIIWKKEPHKSGTPHLHALILWRKWSPEISMMRDWNDSAWCECVATAGGYASPAGQRIELMRTWQGVQSYCSKYCAKLIDHDDGIPVETGKVWGVTFRDNLPIKRETTYHSRVAGIKFKRALRKLHQRRSERWEMQAPDGQWFTVRPMKSAGVLGYKSVDDLIVIGRAAGQKVRKIRPKCMRAESVPIWLECENGKHVLDGYELHSFCSSLHFVQERTSKRLMQVIEAQIAHEEDIAACALLPF